MVEIGAQGSYPIISMRPCLSEFDLHEMTMVLNWWLWKCDKLTRSYKVTLLEDDERYVQKVCPRYFFESSSDHPKL